jgi:hypothetical protein
MKLPIDQIIDFLESNPDLTAEEIITYLKENRYKEMEAICESFHFAIFYSLGQQITDGGLYLDYKYPDSIM